MDEKRMAEIKARAEAATPGEWTPIFGSWTVYAEYGEGREVRDWVIVVTALKGGTP